MYKPWGGNDEISRGVIARKWNVPNHRNSQQGLNVGIMRVRGKRVPEEDEEINLPFGDSGLDKFCLPIVVCNEGDAVSGFGHWLL